MLESGEFATIAELAEHEGIAPSYITRVMRLTLLAPDIVEAILDGRQGPEVTLASVLEPFQWSGKCRSRPGSMLGTWPRCAAAQWSLVWRPCRCSNPIDLDQAGPFSIM
jgi:hypothetical protein